MPRSHLLLVYFASLGSGKTILWCYLIWYLVTVANHFDPSPTIWLNSLGLCTVVGFSLRLSVGQETLPTVDHWQTFRLFLTPFCVSSFSSLIKGQGFFLILSPRPLELVTAVGSCLAFILFVAISKRLSLARDK